MTERKTVHKWWWVWNFEKEEQWLNTMAQSGWALDGVGFCTYHFIPCEPGEYTVRLEMKMAGGEASIGVRPGEKKLFLESRGSDRSYIRFMEETGAEYVGRMAQWIYFRKKTAEGEFDIFSDLDSKIAHLDRIGKALGVIGGANLLIGLVNIWNASHMGWLNLLCATLLMYALGRIHGKKESLQEKRLLLE